MAEGEKFGLRLVGLHALDSLRLEKGYRHWGSDITPDDTPFEAGLGFVVKLDKGNFMGREALLKQKESGPKRRLVIFTMEDADSLIYHDEPIYRNGELVSENTHGAYGHFLGCAIGMGYIENPKCIDDEWILAGEYTINVEGKLIPARAHLKAPYDPMGERIRK
jgi:4-methylaminobutanoate oxidase (formaldehyde-forming)